MSALATALLALLPVLLKEGPDVVAAIEKLIADFKGNGAAPVTPIAPQVVADTQPVVDELNSLKVK